uniref:WW domain-containing protein n=1 Tax=Strigamia maritima TaxID=126957 RepID=T1JH10_STRMM
MLENFQGSMMGTSIVIKPTLTWLVFWQDEQHRSNSNKYSSSKANYGDRYGDKIRNSPSNGGNYRNDSPNATDSPRDRSYHNKSSYSQRLKERERDRRDVSRSPKDKNIKSGGNNRDYHQSSASHRGSESNEHRSNHDRNNTDDVKGEKEKKVQVGDWSEHMSSSGKKYYYNCKTEVSQWEKPKDWLEWEKQQGKPSDPNKVKDRNYDKINASSSSTSSNSSRTSEKHSTDRNFPRSSGSVSNCHSRQHDSRHHTSKSGGNSRNFVPNDQPQHRNQSQHRNEIHSRDRSDQRDGSDDVPRRDGDRRNDVRKSTEDSQMQDMDISPDATPISGNSQPQSQTQTPVTQSSQSQPATTQASVSLANLPKLLSQLAGNKCLPNMDKTELSAQEALQTIQTALLLTRQVSLAQTNMTNQSPHSSMTHNDTSPFLSQKSPLPMPMPSHSADKTRNDEDRGRISPGGSEYSHKSSRRGSPTSSISSLHNIAPAGATSLVSAALRPAAPLISPSLANYVREDLIAHVSGWQADHAERQVYIYIYIIFFF